MMDPSVVVARQNAGILICFSASPLQERAADIARQLSDSHWTSACVVTISRFNSFFCDQEDAHAALCILTQSGKARYLVARKQDPIEVVLHSIVSAEASDLLYLFSWMHACRVSSLHSTPHKFLLYPSLTMTPCTQFGQKRGCSSSLMCLIADGRCQYISQFESTICMQQSSVSTSEKTSLHMLLSLYC